MPSKLVPQLQMLWLCAGTAVLQPSLGYLWLESPAVAADCPPSRVSGRPASHPGPNCMSESVYLDGLAIVGSEDQRVPVGVCVGLWENNWEDAQVVASLWT